MNDNVDSNEEDQVHLVQTLLSVNEVFVYRIPPMKSSGGHRAEDWDLSSPLQTCRLSLDRVDQSCWIQLFVDTWKPLDLQQSANNQMDGSSSLQKVESTLFCRSVITVIPPDSAATANTSTVTETSKVQHMVEPVVDSSRYFVVKIQNTTMKPSSQPPSKTSTRTAHIGIGFRERDDANNFLLALQDYEKSRYREFQAEQMHWHYEQEKLRNTHGPISQDEIDGSHAVESSGDGVPASTISKLTLKEGEKIHVQLKGRDGSSSNSSTLAKKEHKKITPPNAPTMIPLLKKKPPLSATAIPPLQSLSSKTLGLESGLATSSSPTVGTNDDEDEWTDFQES